MADLTEDTMTEEKTANGLKLGRNQKIGLAMWASTMIATLGYMAMSAFKAAPEALPGILNAQLNTWIGFVTPFTVISLGVILGGSAGLKVAEMFSKRPGK
jgi:hypothetical protein